MKQLSHTGAIYKGADNEGRLQMLTEITHARGPRRKAPLRNSLTERYLIALVLTKVCCEVGRGKVERAIGDPIQSWCL